MEIIFWFLFSYIVYYSYSRKTELNKARRNIYIVCTGVLGLCMWCFFRLLLKVDHLSVWFLLAFAALSAQAAYTLGQRLLGNTALRKLIVPSAKTLAGGVILLFFFYNLGKRIIGLNLGGGRFMPITVTSATILTLFGTALWIYGGKLLKKVPAAAYALYVGTLALTPLLLFFIMELSWNDLICNIIIFDLLLNCLIYALLEVIFINIGKKHLIGLQLLYVLTFAVGVVNYFVVNFRGQPIMVSDLSSVWTAVAVAGQYKFQMWDGIASAGIIFYLVFALLSALSAAGVAEKRCRYSKIARPAVSLLTLAAFLIWTTAADFSSRYELYLDFWNPQGTYKATGFATGFISYMQKVKMEQPEGYRAELAEEVLCRYDAADAQNVLSAEMENRAEPALALGKRDAGENAETAENGAGNTSEKAQLPTIIAIMNETYSDLSVLGPLACMEEDLTYLHALKDDPNTLEFGYNYVSTRGGGTSTTEFEFLTGNSMSQLPGVNPYAVFDFSHVPSLVAQLKQQGYHTIAMHPENPRNWRRNVVYPALGFDEFLSFDAFEEYERTVWDRVSDRGDYQKLIDVYEAQDGPAFIFNVTMQNHGGYDINAMSEAERVAVDEAYSQYSDFQMYQSLMKKSDDALRYLLDYFSKVEEPVLICFFGDHQPALNTEFENALLAAGRSEDETELEVQQKYYQVPYFIWSNYLETGDRTEANVRLGKYLTAGEKVEERTEQEAYAEEALNDEGASGETAPAHTEAEPSIISTNYLGPLVLQYAGLSMSDYSRYLLAQREQLPVLNWIGYYASDGQWHALEEENAYQQWIRDYSFVQYQALFDKGKDRSLYSVK